MNLADGDVFSPNEAEALFLAATRFYRLARFDESLALLSQRSLNSLGSQESAIEELQALSQHSDAVGGSSTGPSFTAQDRGARRRTPKEKSFRLKMIDYVESRLTEKELEFVVSKDLPAWRGPTLLYRLAQIRFEQKDYDRLSPITRVARLLPKSRLAELSRKRIQQINARRSADPRTVGAILPLSGRHQKVAYRSLRGLQLGLGIYGKNPSRVRVGHCRFEGNPDVARALSSAWSPRTK